MASNLMGMASSLLAIASNLVFLNILLNELRLWSNTEGHCLFCSIKAKREKLKAYRF